MVRHGGSSAGSYLTDPTFPIPSHCLSIVATSTVRVNNNDTSYCSRRRDRLIHILYVWQYLTPLHRYNEVLLYVLVDLCKITTRFMWIQSHLRKDCNIYAIILCVIELLALQILALKVLVATIDAQWEGMGDVGSVRYELALLPHARP